MSVGTVRTDESTATPSSDPGSNGVNHLFESFEESKMSPVESMTSLSSATPSLVAPFVSTPSPIAAPIARRVLGSLSENAVWYADSKDSTFLSLI
jgi:hypothetical protein